MDDVENLEVVLEKLAEGSKAREGSAVYALHSWSHQMLRVNMFLAKGDKDAMKNALKSLPQIDTNDESKESFNLLIKGYQAYGLARNYKLNAKEEEVPKMLALLTQVLEELEIKQTKIRDKPYYAQYLILFQALKIYRAEFYAEIAGDVGAYSFYQEAIDKQMMPTRHQPPIILYPMEYELAKYYEKKGDLKKSRETYKLALDRMPSHPQSRAAYARLMALYEE
jgi:tetratricopeptide (TPR) repeat protein